MKQTLTIVFFYFLMGKFLFAQPAPYHVVFDMTSNDTVNYRLVVRWVNEVLNASSEARVEVVFYGKSLEMVNKDKSTVAKELEKLAKDDQVALRVCAIALKNNHLDERDLVPGVGIVPDGIYEIISKQHEGWGYIKVSH